MNRRGPTLLLRPVALADRLSRSMMVLAAASTFVLAIVILAGVLSRALAGHPLGGSADIVGHAIVMVVFLQAGYAVRARSLSRASFLIGLMPWSVRRIVLAAGYGLGALLFAALFVADWDPAVTSLLRSGDGGFPAWPARVAILAGTALAAVNCILLALIDLGGPEPTLEQEIDELRGLEP